MLNHWSHVSKENLVSKGRVRSSRLLLLSVAPFQELVCIGGDHWDVSAAGGQRAELLKGLEEPLQPAGPVSSHQSPQSQRLDLGSSWAR